jgi:hypothetical protein
MRSYLWFALGVILFFAWAASYIVFHVAGVMIHLLLVFALLSVMFHAFFGKRAAPRQ